VRETLRFVQLLGQALATMSLYGDTHPARLTVLAQALVRALAADGALRLAFLDGRIAAGARLLDGLPHWEMGARLARVGVQRLEVDAIPEPTGDDVAALLAELRLRLDAPAQLRGPWRHAGIRVGPIAVAETETTRHPTPLPPARAAMPMPAEGRLLDHALGEEAAAVGWLQSATASRGRVPMGEAEAVVHALAATVLADRDVLPPLLALRTFDEYLTIHSCNVAMLAIGLSERLGLGSREVRAIGVAALLHDIGKVRVPRALLVKAGRLTDAEHEQVRAHPVEGARLLAQGDDWLAATVAYEHHIHWHGRGGYPRPAHPRPTHYASRIVQLCDIYDAMCTDRPYRAAVPPQEALALLRAAAGTQVDPDLHGVFDRLVRRSLGLPADDEAPAIAVPGAHPAPVTVGSPA
jgi:HD-GYP domain-containing protein (c-di-GMP phosphodiesterase class II)